MKVKKLKTISQAFIDGENSMRKEFKAELKKLEKLGIITETTKHDNDTITFPLDEWKKLKEEVGE